MKIKIVNATILDVENSKVLEKYTVCIEDSTITFVGENDNLFSQAFVADRIIDFEDDILCAGFVNAHAHNAMSLFRGLKDDVELQQWLYENMFVIEKYLQPDDVFYGTQLGLLESIKSGITTNLDAYFFPKSIVDANIKLGTRCVCALGATLYEDRYKSLKEEYISLPHNNDLVSYMAYAHSIYTIDTKGLEDTVFIAKEFNLPMHIHVSETLGEIGDCVGKYNKTPVQLLQNIGFFEHKCLIAHSVYIDKDDYDILNQHNVSVAHCPASNMKLGSGIAPIYSMLQANINVCLGTDGTASNNSLDMFREMYLASLLQKVNLHQTDIMSAPFMIQMATLNGAKALNLQDKIGEVKVGYKADLIRISTKDVNMIPINDYYSNVVYSAKPENVKMTMVNGQILYENGKFADFIDVEKIVFECNKAIKRLKNESKI